MTQIFWVNKKFPRLIFQKRIVFQKKNQKSEKLGFSVKNENEKFVLKTCPRRRRIKVRKPILIFSCTPLGAQKKLAILIILIFPPDIYIRKGDKKKYRQNYIRQNQNDYTPNWS